MPSPKDEADKARRILLARDRTMAAELVREYGRAWEQIKSELDQITGEIKAARDRGETVNRGWLLKQSDHSAISCCGWGRQHAS